MSPLLIENGNDQPILSVDDWFDLAPPKEPETQWEDGRSAKELANAWFRTERAKVPEELEALFTSNPWTKDLVVEKAIPEKKTVLDDYGGEPRNHDLILVGNVKGIRVVVGVEAKADEPFGPIIKEYLKKTEHTKSKVPGRVRLLIRSIFGRPMDEKLSQLRYQLLHGLAGTLIEAKEQRASLAIFVVHEFLSKKHTKREKIEQNKADFERFVRALPGLEKTSVSGDVLIGPMKIPGGKFVPGNIPALIGKTTTNLQ